MTTVLPSSAQVVIIGGGIVGCSIAYHLASLGVSDVLLIEQNQLTAGTTWHAAGLVAQLRATRNLTQLAKYTTDLFASLEQETGQATGYRQTGSISVALNAERMTELKRQAGTARAFGVASEIIDATEIEHYWPGLDTTGLYGGIYIPGDAQTNPVDTTRALAIGARQRGVQVSEGIAVTGFRTSGRTVTVVETEVGEVTTRQVVLAAGMWTRQLAALLDLQVPLQAAEHFYIVTEALADLTPGMPTLRIPDEWAYYKEDTGKLLLGAFEPRAKPWSPEGVSRDFAFGTLPEDIDHFAPVLEAAARRYPSLQSAGIQTFFNGPESFTPDDRYLLGPAPSMDNVFIAAGFNSIGIQSSGGAGKVLAEWIVAGRPPMDLWDVDIRRTFSFQANRDYLVDRTEESLGLLYAMHWPYRQYETARGARRGPLHDQMIRAGAVMGELAGWERPNWFAQPGVAPEYDYSYGPQNWFDCCRAECDAIANRVALFDQSSYPVFMVEGNEALACLNQISANNIDVAPGSVVYTQWLNEAGGIEADVTITRLSEDQFMVVSSCACEGRDYAWLQRHAGSHQVSVQNVTSGLTMIGLMGPQSRDLLAVLTHDDVSSQALPYYHSKEIELGYARVRVNRLSYVGELGYELYLPTEFAAHVYERIIDHGSDIQLSHAGFHAMNACRIEKGYRHFGHDISDETTPQAAGLGFAVDLDKPAFNGRDALLGIEQPLSERLVNFVLQTDDAVMIYHDEPVFCGDQMVGMTTSSTYGFRLNRAVGIASISHADGVTKDWLQNQAFEIEVAGERFPISVSLGPFYDPKSLRMKS
ncbi:MAG: FAD-dependent oxidoreductase [Gammaproteobacteria bacterium]